MTSRCHRLFYARKLLEMNRCLLVRMAHVTTRGLLLWRDTRTMRPLQSSMSCICRTFRILACVRILESAPRNLRLSSSNIEHIHDDVDLVEKMKIDPIYGREFEMAVTKLRVDRIAALGIATYTRRTMEQVLIAGHLFVNGKMVTRKSLTVKEGDIIDVIRKNQSTDEIFTFDRLHFLRFAGITKHGKHRLTVKRYKALTCPVSEFWKEQKGLTA